MAHIPDTACVQVVRADFSDDWLWTQLTEQILSPTEEGFLAHVDFVEDRSLENLDEAAVVAVFPREYPYRYAHPVVFVVDRVTVASPDHPLLVIDLNERVTSGLFRTTPRQVQSVQNNLSLANMDFFEFARAVDADGVFRGF